MIEGAFRVSGLASGIDSAGIIDALTEVQRIPINQLEQRQQAFRVQLSGVGNLISRLESLRSATNDINDTGLLQSTATEGTTGFSTLVEPGAPAGAFDIQVTNLARAAKARSSAFSSSTDAVAEGTLSLDINGTQTDIDINAGDTLADVAFNINLSSAGVTASVVSDGTDTYLTLTNEETGHVIGQDPSTALQITESYTGGGAQLGLAVTQAAENATFDVDGLSIERQSNTVTDAIPGVTLNLTAETAAPETLLLQRDVEQSEAVLQTFVDAYNSLNELIQGDLSVSAESNRDFSLAGDPSLRGLQRGLQSILNAEVSAAGTTVRALVDIGIETGRDGTLSINSDTFQDALASDPQALEQIFSASGGITELMDAFVDVQTDSEEGILVARQDGLNDRIERADLDIAQMEVRIENFRAGLIQKFTAMESVISGLSATGDFLARLQFPSFGDNG